jgi:NADH-quinone oxidoreductase subunit C
MDAAALLASIQERVPGASLEAVPSQDVHPTLVASRDGLVSLARVLHDDPALSFDFLADLTVVDYLPREPRFEVIYVLVSIATRQRMRLKVRLAGDAARLETVTGIWPGANWLEREAWDLFGIVFDGHPDPRRLLMPEDWEGYPLRKDYPVQIKLPARTTEPLQVTEEQFRANVERDRLTRRS